MTANPGAEAFPSWEGARRRLPALNPIVHRFFPAAAFYFFFNVAGLPTGLYFTTLLSPLLYVWLYCKRQRHLTLKFLIGFSPFLIAHLVNGIASPAYYARSLLLLWTVFISTYALCWALTRTATLARLFDQLIVANMIATGIACVSYVTPLREVLWTQDIGTLAGQSTLYRLRLLSVEPSAYAYLMMPLLVFASLRLFQKPSTRSALYFVMIVIPLLLSQSFGGISIGTAAVGTSLLVTNPRLFKRTGSLVAICVCLICFVGIMVTHNPISTRILQVASGGDSSTKSRTLFSFIAGFYVASSKSLIWGAGLGQIKTIDLAGLNIGFDASVIPNSIAANFAELGAMGVLAKLAIEGWLFFKTRVHKEGFRLACFIVAFIFQFTGGNVRNVQEYMLWFLAFCPLIDPAVFMRTRKHPAELATG